MSQCKICKKKHSGHFLNNKPICMRCDVLLIDIEIACEEEKLDTVSKPIATSTVQSAQKPRAKFN